MGVQLSVTNQPPIQLSTTQTDRCQEVEQLGTLEVFWFQSRSVANVQCTHLASYLQPDEQERAVSVSFAVRSVGLFIPPSQTHTYVHIHSHTHACMHAHTHTHTHTLCSTLSVLHPCSAALVTLLAILQVAAWIASASGRCSTPLPTITIGRSA